MDHQEFRSVIGIQRGIYWRDYEGLRYPDIVVIEVPPNKGPVVRIFNVYNHNIYSMFKIVITWNL
jgi:hypothetical protein